jgi:hypothetical protein
MYLVVTQMQGFIEANNKVDRKLFSSECDVSHARRLSEPETTFGWTAIESIK